MQDCCHDTGRLSYRAGWQMSDTFFKPTKGSWEEKFEVEKCSLWKHMHLRHFFTVIFQSGISGCFIWPAKWCDLRNLTNWTGILLLACGDRHRSAVVCIQFYFQQQRTNLLLIGLADKYLIILRFMIFLRWIFVSNCTKPHSSGPI